MFGGTKAQLNWRQKNMALTTGADKSRDRKGMLTGSPDGETRLDHEGKGFWYSFKKNEKVEAVEKAVEKAETSDIKTKPKKTIFKK